MVISFRPSPKIQKLLENLARDTGKTKSALISEGLERLARDREDARPARTPWEAWKSSVGCVKGLPRDLSTNPKKYIDAFYRAKRARNAAR